MKKFVAILLVVVLMLPVCIPVSAAQITMTDDEFVEAVAQIMKDYYADPDAARQKLEAIGAYLEGEPVLVTHNSNDGTVARGTGFQDYSFLCK